MIFCKCALNVERFCSMLCSSPMSSYIASNVPITVPSLAGNGNPNHAIAVITPAVLRVTVLPPVFEPVITSVEKFSPHETETGTALSFNIGCLASTRRNNFFAESSGITQCLLRIKSSHTHSKSNVPITFSAFEIAFSRDKIFLVSSRRIKRSSSCSSLVFTIKSLLTRDKVFGSM